MAISADWAYEYTPILYNHIPLWANFFFGPTFDLEFSLPIVSKVKFDIFNPLLTTFTQSISV